MSVAVPVIGFNLGLLMAAAPEIRPWSGNPFYWELGGMPVFLAGGSDDDLEFVPGSTDQVCHRGDALCFQAGSGMDSEVKRLLLSKAGKRPESARLHLGATQD